MMKSLTLPAFLLVIGLVYSPTFGAERKVFTSLDQQTVTAEIVSANDTSVTVRFLNGKTVTTPLATLIPDDRTFIAAWRAQNPKPPKYSFITTYAAEKGPSVKGRTGDNDVDIITNWLCRMKVENRCGQDLNDLEVHYNIYWRSGRSKTIHNGEGKTLINTIRSGQRLDVATRELQLHDIEDRPALSQRNGYTQSGLRTTYYVADKNRAKQIDKILGMNISLHHQGELVFNWSSPDLPTSLTQKK